MSRRLADAERWAACGAMALTGPPGGRPLGPPAGLVPGLDALAAPFPGLDGPALLGERAAFSDLTRRGRVSCGGAARLLPCADGWLAVSLPRPSDLELVPAWLESPVAGPLWEQVAAAVSTREADDLVARAELLGLAVAALPTAVAARPPVLTSILGEAPPREIRGLRVVDLTSLWAGPLCGDLLGRAGAEVIKVESVRRPDGTRSGPPGFFTLLNGGKRSVALDFGTREGVDALTRLVRSADVVLEASRPRALEQLGLSAAALVSAGGPRLWVSITGHGREHPLRIAFGDDAAIGGGLISGTPADPYFCADAAADPATGLTAAHACVTALRSGGRRLLDISMTAAAAALSGPPLPLPSDLAATPPHARPPRAAAAPLGADTAEVLAGLD